MTRPVLIAFGGLPGAGKTTIARAIAGVCEATYLRIDTIEQAIRSAGVLVGDVGAAGYIVAYGIATANLKLGRSVVADSVNPLPVTRDAWRDVAHAASAAFLEVEIICGDPIEHRRRVETRKTDIPGLVLPQWADVTARHYAAWTRPHLVVDTARLSVDQAVVTVRDALLRSAENDAL